MPWLRRYSQMACVMARMWASVKVPLSDVPRWPLVPKLTSWFGSAEIGLALVVFAFELGDVDQHVWRVRVCPREDLSA